MGRFFSDPVEQALKRVAPGMRILDLCTGSGCILLSVLANCEGVAGVGADLSEQALEVARKNASDLKIQAEFCRSDLFDQIEGTFDLILILHGKHPSTIIDPSCR